MLQVFSQYVSRKAFLLMAADAGLMTFSVAAGVWIRHWDDPGMREFETALPNFAYRVAAIVLCFGLCAYYNELYNPNVSRGPSDDFFRLAQTFGAGCFILAFVYFLVPSLRIGRGGFAIAVALMLLLLAAYRVAADIVWRRAVPPSSVLILGVGDLAAAVAREIDQRPDLNMRIAGFVRPAPDGGAPRASVASNRLVGEIPDIEGLAKTYAADKIIVGLEEQRGVLPVRELLRLRTRGVRIDDANSVMAALTGRISLDTVRSTWFIFSDGFRRDRSTMAVKRALDLGLSTIGLIMSAPVLLVAAAAVKLDSPGPVLYRQTRVGLDGRDFEVLKFRTMRNDAEADGVARWAKAEDPRVTRVGGFMRKYRIDELPQFLNVIRGNMSFVGPRPERPEFVEDLRREIPFYDERHTVRPGITGWAQVCYPYGATVEDALRKLEFDLFYLKNISILFDVAIVFETVKTVLWGRGR